MALTEILVAAMAVCLVLSLLIGIPVFYSLAGIGVLFVGIGALFDTFFDTSTGVGFHTIGLVVNRIFSIMENWVLLALPMFIFMGVMLEKSGLAERMMLSMQVLLGRVRGGLAVATMIIGILLAASTGIVGASVALLGMISLDVMLKQGYRDTLALGTVLSAGTLGILAPPSIMLIVMADQLSISVGDLFLGALLPSLLLASLYIIYLLIYSSFSKDAVPDISLPSQDERVIYQVWFVVKNVVPAMLLILIVLGSIFTGIATPTEASGLGAMGATLLALVYRRLNKSVLVAVVEDTYKVTSYIIAILIGATCFALVFRELGGDELITGFFSNLSDTPTYTIIAILATVFLLGFILDWIEITLIVLPIVAPIITGLDLEIANLSMLENADLIWFAILVAVVLQTSFLTPPVGFSLFYLKAVCRPSIKMQRMYFGVIPFILIQLVALAIIIINFPALVTWLPFRAFN